MTMIVVTTTLVIAALIRIAMECLIVILGLPGSAFPKNRAATVMNSCHVTLKIIVNLVNTVHVQLYQDHNLFLF